MTLKTTIKDHKAKPLTHFFAAVALGGLITGAMGAHAQEDEKTMEQYVQDGWKEGKVETLFLLNPHLNSFKLDAEVKGDRMILDGTVDSVIDKDLAEAIAANINGIAAIENRIVVEPEAHVTNKDIEQVKQQVSDLKVLTVVKGKLVKNPHIAGFAIDVDASDGVVTLSGEVDSSKTRELAKWLAMGTNGVTRVENNLQVNTELQQ